MFIKMFKELRAQRKRKETYNKKKEELIVHDIQIRDLPKSSPMVQGLLKAGLITEEEL